MKMPIPFIVTVALIRNYSSDSFSDLLHIRSFMNYSNDSFLDLLYFAYKDSHIMISLD